MLDLLFSTFLMTISCVLGLFFYKKPPRKPWKASLVFTMLSTMFIFALCIFLISIKVIPTTEYREYNSTVVVIDYVPFTAYLPLYSVCAYLISYFYLSLKNMKRKELEKKNHKEVIDEISLPKQN